MNFEKLHFVGRSERGPFGPTEVRRFLAKRHLAARKKSDFAALTPTYEDAYEADEVRHSLPATYIPSRGTLSLPITA